MTYQDLINVLSAMGEVQRNAGRFIENNKLRGEKIWVNSLPFDMEMELSAAIRPLQPIYDEFIKTRTKLIESLGWKIGKTGWEADIEKPDPASKEVIDKEIDGITDVEVPNIPENLLPLKTFNKNQLKESGIEFSECPNKQFFFNWCVPK